MLQVFVDETCEDRALCDPFVVEVRDGVVWLWRSELLTSVRSLTVVVPYAVGQYG
ncbi:hypothetical protein [Saccharopolyspora hattusasensis]|uniref:hypothetical protein n=1 Tax=Saccharopolyspora hattusasensis TaxID=1128679 RepID=UPI003D95B34E